MNKLASLCILGYKRPDMLMQCIDSIHSTIDYPCEIIVSIDGEDNPDQHAASIAYQYFRDKKISKLISIGGKNRGVGRSFENCLGMAEGDYIFKIDTDLIFKPKWLSTAISVLDSNLDVGAVSLFDYRHYDAHDTRFEATEFRDDCVIVTDFVSSIYGFRKKDLYMHDDGILFGNQPVPDDGLHQRLGDYRGKLAITPEDFVENQGFGLGKSVYVVPDKEGNPIKATTYSEPKLFSI